MGFLSWLFGRKSDAPSPPPSPRSDPPPRSTEPSDNAFGTSPHNPILCDQPSGERAYIASLRCPSGHRIAGPRRGSMSGKCTDPSHHASLVVLPGHDPAEECIVDCYDLVCEGGEYSCTLYFDMYHPNPPRQPAPAGLTRAG